MKFRSPLILTCTSCAAHFHKQVEAAASEMVDKFRGEFTVERGKDGGFAFKTGSCTEPSMVFRSKSTSSKRLPSVGRLAREWVRTELRATLWTAREASIAGGAVFSNSRIGLGGLLQCEGRLGGVDALLLLDRDRHFTVPWVSELDPLQIVQLREEASSALPLLREKLCSAMTASDATVFSRDSAVGVISELREQAAEVRAELEAKRRTAARFWKGTFGILSLGLSAYGVATDQLIPGVAGLLPIIQLLINHKAGHEAETAKLTRRPGYVLVKAQDILSHADAESTERH